MTRSLLIGLAALVVLPVALAAWQYRPASPLHWSEARWSSSGLAPDPATTPEAVVQVYAARTYGWKGVVATHSWIILKEAGAAAYERYDVAGWGVSQGRPAVRRNLHVPDGFWAGNRPTLLAQLRGPAAAAAIVPLRAAIDRYPYPRTYVTWPGPNSNTFIAYLLRSVPALGTALPPTAVGKDFLVGGSPLALTPSRRGVQVSLYGLLGLTVALDEGLELNLGGLVLGVDPLGLAVKLPGLGRLSLLHGRGPGL